MTGRAMRRRVALLAIFAILLQAVLFGWHHHELELPSSGGTPAAFAAGGAPVMPAAEEDSCEICIALHHLSAAPDEFVVLALPAVGPLARRCPEFAFIAGIPERGFRARAPPVA